MGENLLGLMARSREVAEKPWRRRYGWLLGILSFSVFAGLFGGKIHGDTRFNDGISLGLEMEKNTVRHFYDLVGGTPRPFENLQPGVYRVQQVLDPIDGYRRLAILDLKQMSGKPFLFFVGGVPDDLEVGAELAVADRPSGK